LLTSFPRTHTSFSCSLRFALAPLAPPPHTHTHSNFKKAVDAIAFSPDDQFVAVSHGNHTKVWRAPALRREFSPFSLHRTYTGHHADVICLSWSPDSQFLLTGSKDNSARLYTLHPQAGFIPNTFGGHRDHVIGAFFAPNVSGGDDFTIVYTVTKDGAVLEWQWVPDEAVKAIADVEKAEEEEEDEEEEEEEEEESEEEEEEEESEEEEEAETKREAGRGQKRRRAGASGQRAGKRSQESEVALKKEELSRLAVGRGHWKLAHKHLVEADYAKVHSCVFHAKTNVLVLGFSSGVFGLYTMPGCNNIHTLSVSQNKIDTVVLNPTGDWLAMASATLGQLLVWEWESETYVMKQQGHFFDLNVVAYSADGQHIATGGDDGKIKMWNTNTGFCFVTFSEHEAPITALTFTSKETGNAVIRYAAQPGNNEFTQHVEMWSPLPRVQGSICVVCCWENVRISRSARFLTLLSLPHNTVVFTVLPTPPLPPPLPPPPRARALVVSPCPPPVRALTGRCGHTTSSGTETSER
jgi:periodic tryptophan protein 2